MVQHLRVLFLPGELGCGDLFRSGVPLPRWLPHSSHVHLDCDKIDRSRGRVGFTFADIRCNYVSRRHYSHPHRRDRLGRAHGTESEAAVFPSSCTPNTHNITRVRLGCIQRHTVNMPRCSLLPVLSFKPHPPLTLFTPCHKGVFKLGLFTRFLSLNSGGTEFRFVGKFSTNRPDSCCR